MKSNLIVGGVFTIYEKMCLESRRLDEQINSLHSQIESLPEGKIICTPNGKSYKWYRSDGHKSVYIPKYPENKIHKTSSGNKVRSKSEVLIDMVLYTHKIPFRYECELQLGDFKVYPDFTIMHPKTGKIIYWEHFGKMDDPKYNRNVGDRIQTYVNNGIVPSIDLIVTYETSTHPLAIDEVEKIVKEYFL